jgi:hypothetical protein
MRLLAQSALLAGLIISLWLPAAAADCSLACPEGDTCYASAQEGLDCMLAVPFNEVSAMLCYAMLCYAMLCYAILYYAML